MEYYLIESEQRGVEIKETNEIGGKGTNVV
jgi:hypothetical protein